MRVEKFCKSLLENDFEVYILARWGDEKEEKVDLDGFRIIRVGFEKKYLLSTPIPFNPLWRKSIRKTIKEIQPDLIIVREIMLAEETAKAAHKFGIPVIMDMAENYPAALREWKKYNRNWFSRFLIHTLKIPDLVEKRAVRRMDGIITVCEEQNQRLEQQYNFPQGKVVIVHNTPPLTKFENVHARRFGNSFIIGHHGFHTSEKSIKNFLIAFVKTFAKNPDFTLVIAGDGDDIPEFMEIADKVKNVKFLGKFAPDKLNQILSGFDIGILPYQINDFNNYTIHNKVFDYFALGIPVIVSEAMPLKRLIKETKAGISIDCESPQSISEFLKKLESQNWERLSDNARESFLNKYNWENDAKNLIDFCIKFF